MKTNKRPIIGISGSVKLINEGVFQGHKISYMMNNYVESVERAGGIPYIIPIAQNDEIIKSQVENIDALILSGGSDVNPLLFGEEPIEKLDDILQDRDIFDIKLLKFAMELGKPILGICRGEQLINMVNEGTVYQDLSLHKEHSVKHCQNGSPTSATHTVQIIKDSILHEILGEKALVNSFHHQAVKEVAKGFKVVAVSKDNVVEAIEKEGEDFVLGIQWHPEMMSDKHQEMQKIFDTLVQKSSIK